MNIFFHKQLFAVVLIAVTAILIIVGVWGIVLYGQDETALTTTTMDTMQTTESAQASSTTTEPLPPPSTTTSAPPVVKPTGKLIALTFDDGPSSTYTAQILDLLEQYNAKATFFINGYQLGMSKTRLLQRMVDLGCEIGNHTEDHARLTDLSEEDIYEQLHSVNEKVRQICGYQVTLMRPPGGHTDLSVMEAMYDSGLRMKTILWNNDSLDWSFNADYQKGQITREEAVRNAYDMICGYPLDGAIVLMHDIKGITPDVLELLLQKLIAEGYTFVTVSEMFDFESMGESAYFSKFYAEDRITPMK